MSSDLTIEPKYAVRNMLRIRMQDYNKTGRPAATQWIFTGRPRRNLKQNHFPRIRVEQVTETSVITDIGRKSKYMTHIQADIYSWQGADGADAQILEIGGVKYETETLLDLLGRDLINALDDNKSDFDDDTLALRELKLLANLPSKDDPDMPQVRSKTVEFSFMYYR